jgi:hypothetical protein
MKKHRIWLHLCIIPAAAAAFIAAFGCAVMLLWNALLPRIAGLPAISFWEAAGLLILARLLFGGFGGLGGHHGHKNPFREKWAAMDDGERKAFVAQFHRFRHHGACAGDGAEAGPASEEREKGGPEMPCP